MKRWGWIMAWWLWATMACAAETIEAQSKITAVTVFPDRAAVTRESEVRLPQGAHTISMGPLPSRIEPDSVTAKGLGESDVALHGVRLVTEQLTTAQDPRVSAIETEIQSALHRQRQYHNLLSIVELERKYLSSIQAASSEQIGKDLITKSPSATDAAALLTFLDASLLKTFEREQEAHAALEDIARALEKLRRELAELRQGQAKQSTTILVDVHAVRGGTFALAVSYRLPGATWQPSYEARTSTASNEVEFTSYGLVRQRTGEDWKEAELTLSTAKPAIAGSMPELQPWFLKPWESPPPATTRTRVANFAMAPEEATERDALIMKKEDKGGDTLQTPATLAVATVETQGPSVTFRLPKPASVPADWQPHKVPIRAQQFKAEIAYEATPKLMPYAFLRAKVNNTADVLYVAGPISVFLDGAFVSTASLKQVAPSETFDLYLGVDERVKVERKPLKEHVEVSLLPGLRGKTKSTDYEFLTTIENLTGRRILITVFDHLPVSEREAVVVESVKRTPSEVDTDPEKPGVFHWTFGLSPSQKQELRLAYRVRHPVDMRLDESGF